MPPVKLLIIGAGNRGTGFANIACDYPGKVQVVGVADPREFYRTQIARQHKIFAGNVFSDWRQAAAKEKFADAVLICTQDTMHVEPALAFAKIGYHMMLEKPIAPTEKECRKVVAAVEKAGILFAVCHVMRYTDYTQKLKSLISAGVIGEVVSIQHLEPVGYWHQAHSYVRGNWRNEAISSPMLLAKSCHDLDWLRYIMDCPCKKISSFGSLRHFRKENKPARAADRCMDCPVEANCPYSAVKIYLRRAQVGDFSPPTDVITSDMTLAGVEKSLRETMYGKCVYSCDNDVVDNQVVAMEFEGGRTACFTMTAFYEMGHRRTKIFGTRGRIEGDGEKIEVYDFLTDKKTMHDAGASDGTIRGGHGGGDVRLFEAFIAAVASGDGGRLLSGAKETLESHLMVFAAEKARLNNTVEIVKA